MKNGSTILFYLLILRGCLACQHESVPIEIVEKPVEKTDSCSLKNVTYVKVVKGIFDDYCIKCHGNTIMSKGYNFQGFDNLKLWFSLDSLRLLHAIRHEKGLPMPLGGDKIPECKIRQIETWVREGLKEN